MPRLPDKIIINEARTMGTHQAIAGEYKSLRTMAQEIMDGGWAGETDALKVKMKAACDAHDAADLAYLAALRNIVQETADFIDSKHP